CAEYASTVCGEAGEQSDTCSAIRRAAELMPGAACRAALGDTTRMRAGIADAAKACNDLMSRLCAELGEGTPTCAMVREQTPRFNPEKCRQMLDNYPAVYKELQCREMQAKPLAPEALAKLGAGDGPSFGPADAKVTVVEFSDFECSYCVMAADVVRKVKARYGTVVRFIFRHLPLPFHRNAGPAAQASLAAHAQGKFWRYHDLLFANQNSLDRAGLERLAGEAGLDMAQFGAALDGGTHAAAVDADKMLAEELCVNGTPSMFVNADRVRNPTEYAELSSAIDAALTAAGVPIPPEPTR
ncbi:MAG: thioredoxin domain-containing protein, partial [Myxococcota bacterium]|nr:thioredoxin domain-containing protein [Myxococcota bacterium]